MLKFFGFIFVVIGGVSVVGMFDGKPNTATTPLASATPKAPMSPEQCQMLAQSLVLKSLDEIISDRHAGRLTAANVDSEGDRRVADLDARLSAAGCGDAAARSNASYTSPRAPAPVIIMGQPMVDPTLAE